MGHGHSDYLPVIRGVGEDFLITGQADVEDDLPGSVARSAKANAGPESSIFKGEQGRGG